MLFAFRDSNLSCYPLESCIAVAHLNLLFVCNLLDDFSGHDSLHDKVTLLHLVHRLSVGDDIIEEEQTGLVTVDENPLALIILACHTYAVSIRVAGHDDICIHGLSITECECQRLTILGVR